MLTWRWDALTWRYGAMSATWYKNLGIVRENVNIIILIRMISD